MKKAYATGREKTVVFLHIPKAAGSTLHVIIARQYPPEAVFSNDRAIKARLGERWKETPAIQRWELARDELSWLPAERKEQLRVVKGHMLFGWHELLPQPATYITFLREPVECVLSQYYHILRYPEGHYICDQVIGGNMSLREYVESGIHWVVDNGQVRMLSGIGDSVPFGECTQEHLEAAKYNLENHFSMVGLTEEFDRGLILLKNLFGWSWPLYYRRNVGVNRPAHSSISAEDKQAIANLNWLDTNLYEYVRERFYSILEQQDASFERNLQTFQRLNRWYARGYALVRPFDPWRRAGRKLLSKAAGGT